MCSVEVADHVDRQQSALFVRASVLERESLLTTLQVLGVAAVALTVTLCAWGPWLPKWIQMGVMDGRPQRPLLAFRILVVSFSCYSSSRVRTRALPDDCGHRLVPSGGLCRQGACSEATTRLASAPLRLANFNWILVSFAFLFLSYFLLTHSLTVYSSTVLSDCLELVEGLVCPLLTVCSLSLLQRLLPNFWHLHHPFDLRLLFHCTWVVLDGAPLLLAFDVDAVAGAPVWPVGAVMGFVPLTAVAGEAAAGCTISSFSIWLRSSSKSSRTSCCHPFSKSKKMYLPTSFWTTLYTKTGICKFNCNQIL